MPASFPTSIVTWTDVVDNTDTILASHMNNAYAEIIAIETVLDTYIIVSSTVPSTPSTGQLWLDTSA